MAVIIKKSDESVDVLRKRWDYMTSEAFYAGCDNVMDIVFTGKRKADDRVVLIHKPPSIRSTFVTIFKGKIIATENGSAITGSFVKRISDYIIFAVLTVLFMVFVNELVKTNLNLGLMLAIAWGLLALLLLYPLKSARKKYEEFLQRIIDGM